MRKKRRTRGASGRPRPDEIHEDEGQQAADLLEDLPASVSDGEWFKPTGARRAVTPGYVAELAAEEDVADGRDDEGEPLDLVDLLRGGP